MRRIVIGRHDPIQPCELVEIERLIDLLTGHPRAVPSDLAANACGFMRRVPSSTLYRRPPNGADDDVPIGFEIRQLLLELRATKRIWGSAYGQDSQMAAQAI
jgi:hypothetical protein